MPAFRENPDFPADPAEVLADWNRMRDSRRGLVRPVVVLAGWRAPRFRGGGMAARLASVTSGSGTDFLSVTYAHVGDLRRAARISLARIAERWPAGVEVDVVGISMGGLVARLCAAGAGDGLPRLKIARLFTLATPHRGARLAKYFGVDRAARDMRAGSGLLCELDRALADAAYDLACYGQLRDWWVGATNTAPPGYQPFWTDARTPPQRVLSHFLINSNIAVLRDMARRLRGEEPVARRATQPPAD